MRYTKKIFFITLSVCLLITQADAAWRTKRPRYKRTRRAAASHTLKRSYNAAREALLASERRRILEERMERTFARAEEAQKRVPYSSVSRWESISPQYHSRWALRKLNPKHIYPDKPFLAHPIYGGQLTEAYILSQTNRAQVKHLEKMKTFLPRFVAAIPRFQKEAWALAQPKDPLRYAVEQIPGTVKNIFVGEVHNQPDIVRFISNMLPLLRKKYADKPIFLFTEFVWDIERKGKHLPDTAPGLHETDYIPIWQSAAKENIPIIGLEPKYVEHNFDFSIINAKGEEEWLSIWTTLEGMRLRNEHWWKIIEQYRAENPDAIFIIYTGSAHSFYEVEFSLSARLPKAETFMLELVVKKRPEEGKSGTRDNLEEISPQLSFPQQVLHWKSKDLAELSGFDMRIRVTSSRSLMWQQFKKRTNSRSQKAKISDNFSAQTGAAK